MSISILAFLYPLQLLLAIVLGLATLYIFIFALAGLFYRQLPYPVATKKRRIAVLVPGYKEDEVIVDIARDALEQDYPKDAYDVVIIADSFRPETLQKLGTLPVKVIEVSFENSTKSKALNKAMEQLGDDYELAVVLDADNLMAPDFLSKVNAAFESGLVAVQGHRTAKNLNTSLAILDAISEEINNHIFRKGHRVLGLSSAIIGSGMAFDYPYFKGLMKDVKAIGGFDKEIELKMLKQGHTIQYLNDALVYDEKVQKAEVFSNQRRRWLSAQFHYFRQYFPDALKDLLTRGNIDYFDKSIQFVQPPRILLLGSVIVFGIGFILLNLLTNSLSSLTTTWGLIIAGCILAFAFSVPRAFYSTETLTALKSLPKGMLLMLGSLLKIRGANKKFIHTSHTAIKTDKKP